MQIEFVYDPSHALDWKWCGTVNVEKVYVKSDIGCVQIKSRSQDSNKG